MADPLLVIVTGYDPSTRHVAAAIANRIPCPVIARDEIKDGLVYTAGDYAPEPGDPMNRRTFEAFFGVVEFLVDAGVTLVAEASFQHNLWRAGLEPRLLQKARIRVVRCRGDARATWERIVKRANEVPSRLAIHGEPSLSQPYEAFEEKLATFEQVALDVPTIDVDVTGRFSPSADKIVAFVKRS